MNIILIEDNIVQQDLIEIFIQDCGHNLVAKFTSAEEAELQIQNIDADLVLMDINLDGAKNGIELANDITRKQNTPIIFTTSQTATETLKNAAEKEPIDILIKPIQFEQLQASLILAELKKKPNSTVDGNSKFVIKDEFLIIKKGHLFERNLLKDLLYVEGMGNYFNLYFSKEKITIKGTLSEIENALPKDNFTRANRSVIIALNHVKSFNPKRIYMTNGQEFVISKKTSDQLMLKLIG